jgi:alkanesulfonate monooxygenase SsuD/methylene tetrahydromethanopterin reductase-like flavin-dependent oxidoreductase (luciferase family)
VPQKKMGQGGGKMKPLRKFRFGFVAPDVSSRSEWCETARQIEGAGYDILLLGDHPADDDLAPVPALVSAADATTRLRVGSMVFDNDLRNPVMLAKEAHTLDLLTEGRFELGIGAGWRQEDYDRTGIPFDPPGPE